MLKARCSLPWLCAGDFNECLDAREQFGGAIRMERQMDRFCDAMSEFEFIDLGFIGLPFTWDNRQQGNQNVKVRLDRGLATTSFLDLYDEVKVWHAQTTQSDHCGLIVECLGRSAFKRNKSRCFKYENMWRRHAGYMSVIRDSWSGVGEAANLSDLQIRLGNVQRELQA